jgi:hypothetical protein
MALYDKNKLYEQSKEAIEKNNLFFIEDIVAWLPCTKATFYEYFPLDSDELNELKGMLEVNKIRTKSSIRAKLFRSEKAGELLALYRLICTPEERRMLNQSYLETEYKGKIDIGSPLDNIRAKLNIDKNAGADE